MAASRFRIRRWYRPPRLLLPALVALLLALGVLGLPGHGIQWDEFTDHQLGAVTLNYVLRTLTPARWQAHLPPPDPRTPWLPSSGIVHGPVIEAPAALLGRLLYPGQPAGYYAVRHAVVFGVFGLGVLALYGLARLRFGDWRLALLPPALLLLSPRFFAEAFYNGKDVGFMALLTVAMLALAWLVRRPAPGRLLLAAAAAAAAIGVRMPGIVAPALGMAWLGYRAALGRGQGVPGAGRGWAVAAGYALATAGFTVAFWPYLWAHPVRNFGQVLGIMSRVPWPGTVWYLGRLWPAPRLPWHYLPVWVLATTPVAYWLAAAGGLGAVAARAIRQPGRWLRSWHGQLDALLLLWGLGPLVVIVALRSVVFDGWRHAYFVYPALLLLAARGVQVAGRWAWAGRNAPACAGAMEPAANFPARHGAAGRRWAAGLALAGLALGMARSAWFIGRAHPNQQAYFSCLPPATAERLLERDYWGLSNRYGLEWILRHDPAPVIAVSGAQVASLYVNWLVLPPTERQRLRIVSDQSARYYLSGYRWHPQPYADSLGPEVLAYRPGGGVKVLSVFRRDSLARPLPPTPIGYVTPGLLSQF